MVERRTGDGKVAGSIPDIEVAEFSSPEFIFCALLVGVRSTPVSAQ